MRAAEDHRVDARFDQRRAVAAHDVDDLLVEQRALLDDRRQSGHGDLDEAHEWVRPPRSPSRTRRSLTVVGVAKQPDAAVVRRRHGLHRGRLDDAEDVDPQRRLQHPPRSAGSAAAVAELQATTISFASRASSSSAISSENASSSSRLRMPYGKRAASARYTKSSCGRRTSSSCSTVSPPTPESKTPTGRRRSSSGTTVRHAGSLARARAGRRRRQARAGPASLPPTSSIASLSLLDRPRWRSVVLKPPLAVTTPASSTADQQDQADVLDRALPALLGRAGDRRSAAACARPMSS